jgi:hypothetical protein
MADIILRCPCGEPVMIQVAGKVKVRTNIVIFENGHALVKCRHCKSDLTAPITTTMPLTPKKPDVKLVILPSKS